MDLASTTRRFLDGLATNAEVDRGLLDRPGTTVVGSEDRADSGAVACYRVGAHLVVWGDPAVVDRAAGLNGPEVVAEGELTHRLEAAGFARQATVISNLLDGSPTPPAPVPAGYVQRWLEDDAPATVAEVRAFVERCDPDDVEAAGLDELDEFDEAAINVLVADRSPAATDVSAYASASRWFWDATMADIGVLVHGEHRRRGLAHFVVASTVARLIDDGRIPFYRHEASNIGSAAVAASMGFRPVARLDYFVEQS